MLVEGVRMAFACIYMVIVVPEYLPKWWVHKLGMIPVSISTHLILGVVLQILVNVES